MQNVEMMGKKIQLEISNKAKKQLRERTTPLFVEMELYFSCLIRKKVRFRENQEGDLVNVNEQLSVRFRPVMTAVCGVDYEGDEPPLTDFPIKKIESFVPHWLKIDFKNNEWIGEFGF